jgi:hypothetical protein
LRLRRPALSLLLLLGGITGGITGCNSPGPQSDAVVTFRLASVPSLDIGQPDGHAARELYRVTDAVQLPDGRLVIANSGSSELRYFDSAGEYLTAVGRRGAGPGEFTGDLSLLPYYGDSLLVWDARLRRFSLFDSDGAFARTLSLPPGDTLTFPWDTWLYRRVWLEGAMPHYRHAVARVVDSIRSSGALPATDLLVARFDARLLWVTPASDQRRWTAHDGTGGSIGSVVVPPGLEPYQFGADFVIGRWTDTLGVEHIRKYAYTPHRRGTTQPIIPSGDSDQAPLTASIKSLADPATGRILAALSTLIGLQEAYYVDHARYAHTSDSLSSPVLADGALTILSADHRGWVATLVRPDSPLTCAVAVGASTPPAWHEGIPKCG